MTVLTRMWINQPSKLQPLHHLNGTNVLAHPETDEVHRVYFLSGDVVSQLVPSWALSRGWIKPRVANFGDDDDDD